MGERFLSVAKSDTQICLDKFKCSQSEESQLEKGDPTLDHKNEEKALAAIAFTLLIRF